MELFPVMDEEQLEFIKRVIDDYDYYILIIGGRYGSTTPWDTQSNMLMAMIGATTAMSTLAKLQDRQIEELIQASNKLK